jgi:hypothetical protein
MPSVLTVVLAMGFTVTADARSDVAMNASG